MVKTVKILIMDDEKIVRDITSKILLSLGYSVVTTKDGNEALKEFKKSLETGDNFDAAILDLTIPYGMGGKEALDGIRKLDNDIPVIVSSGYSEDPIVQNPVKYGFTDSIIKPFKVKGLIEMLSRYLKS